MFVFGAQYLRGFTPYRKDWDRDLSRMKDCGFNTVRAWIVWNVVQKGETEIDFDYLHSFLDTVGKYDMQAGLLFHLHGAPEWMIKKYPHYYYVNAEGNAFEPSARSNTPSGGWPGLCFDYPEVQQLEADFISRVVEGLSGRKEIAFWEPMNEPHQWVDLSKNPVGAFCYCPATREKFRLWLKNKYGSIEALNEAWGRYHRDWDEIRPPTWRFGYTDQIDFRLFTMDNIREEIQRRTDVIRKFDSRPVIAHAWGGGTVTCTNIGAMAFDDWKNATVFDKWGYSAFPDSYKQNVILGLGTDATRSAARGKEMWQSELGTGDLGSGLDRRGRVKPEVLAGWTWESICHGAKGVLYWQYRKEAHGSEFGNMGLTDYAGGPTEVLETAAQIGRTLQENRQLFLDSKVEAARVALVFSMNTFLVDWCDHRSSQLAIDSLSGYYRMFWEENIPVDILHEDYMSAEDLLPYRLVITPLPAALSGNAREVLKAYVQQGGTLLSDPYFCPYTTEFHLQDKVPGDGYDQVFGCYEKDIYSAGPAVNLKMDGEVYAVDKSHFKEYFVLNGGRPLALYQEDGEPALVENGYGKGKAVISGVNLGFSYSPRLGVGDDFVRNKLEQTTAGAKQIVLTIAESLGIGSSFKADCPLVQGGFLLGREQEDILILINHSEESQECIVQIHENYMACRNVMDHREVAIDDHKLKLVFAPLETKVLKLRK